MRKTTKNKKRGGRFLGSGTYGCTYIDPPLKCKGEKTRRVGKLSKLMKLKEANSEVEKNTIYKIIDPEKKYTLWTDETCDFDGFDDSNKYSKNKKECNYDSIIGDLSTAKILFLTKADIDLEKIVLRPSEYSDFFSDFTNLIEGVLLFKNNNVAHMDIKPPNIVSTKQGDGSFKLQYIDFGLSKNINNIDMKNEHKKYLQGLDSVYTSSSYSYIYYPFELRFIYKTNPPDPNVDYSYTNWIDFVNSSTLSIPDNVYRNINQSIMDNIITNIDFSNTINILKNVDIYSLGISFCQIYSRLTGHYSRGADNTKDKQIMVTVGNRMQSVYYYNGNVDSPPSDIPIHIFEWHKNLAMKVSAPMYQMIEGMINFNMKLRKGPEESLSMFNSTVLPNLKEVFNSPHTKEALEFIKINVIDDIVPVQTSLPNLVPVKTSNKNNKGRKLPDGWYRVSDNTNSWYYDNSTKKSHWSSPLNVKMNNQTVKSQLNNHVNVKINNSTVKSQLNNHVNVKMNKKEVSSVFNKNGKLLPYGWQRITNGNNTWYADEFSNAPAQWEPPKPKNRM